ncbi:MAG: hypothetical protein WCC87_15925 [Candidatus Korobacteraceae bacterium]
MSIDLVSVWEEVDCYSERERAAFAWAESVTKVSETHVPDEVFGFASKHFSAEELAKLTLAVVVINGWNRFCIAFRSEPGRYQPGSARNAEEFGGLKTENSVSPSPATPGAKGVAPKRRDC